MLVLLHRELAWSLIKFAVYLFRKLWIYYSSALVRLLLLSVKYCSQQLLMQSTTSL